MINSMSLHINITTELNTMIVLIFINILFILISKIKLTISYSKAELIEFILPNPI